LNDGKRAYENGLPTIKNPAIPVDNNTVWGRVPSNPIQVTNAFSTIRMIVLTRMWVMMD
jgi:hypothetical protein